MSAIAKPLDLVEDRAPGRANLRLYTREKIAIAAQLRALLDALKKREDQARFSRCEALVVKLAENCSRYWLLWRRPAP